MVWPVGIPLFLLLIFTTLTVFVRQGWPLLSFDIGIYTLAFFVLVWQAGKKSAALPRTLSPWLVYLIPVWGAVQILAHWTTAAFVTRQETLKWGALAAVFFLVRVTVRNDGARRIAVDAFLWFGTFIGALCLLQLFTSEGKVFWLFSSGYPDVYASFQSPNNYAQFVELAFPIALWRTVRTGLRSWWYCLAAAILFASVIGSASRAGVVLCIAEFVAIAIYAIVKPRDRREVGSRAGTAVLIAVPMIAMVFTVVVGWHDVVTKFKTQSPFIIRHEFIVAAVHEAEARPFTGFGLGTFPQVYQQFAVKDFPFIANHTHCDWAEFAADGGIPFLFLVLTPFALAVPAALRRPWAWGLLAVMLHACVDYPFPRPAVSAWMFMMLALLQLTEVGKRQSSVVPIGTARSMSR